MWMNQRPTATRLGQGMTEYIIIVVLVAIAVLIGVLIYGKTIEEKQMGADVTVDGELDTSGAP